MTTGALVLLAAVVLTAAFGLLRAARDGRFRAKAAPPVGQDRPTNAPREAASAPSTAASSTPAPSALAGTAYDAQRGDRATLLQFSSAFCAPCRATRRVLGDIATAVPGVAHVEVDAEQQLDLVRRLGVLRTPTTLVLDAHGAEVARAAGAPRKEQVLSALDQAGLA